MALLYNEFINKTKKILNDSYDSSRFERLLNSEFEYQEGDIIISGSKLSSIKRFYNNTNDYNKRKISEIINNNIRNVETIYEFIIEYETMKYKQYKKKNRGK